MAAIEQKTQQKSSGSRKTVDKWKKKKWFTILSSKIFDKKPLCETPGEKPKNIMDRTFKTTMDMVTGQRTKRDYVLSFKVNDIQGQTASTVISKFEVNKGTLGRTVRRRNSKVGLVEKLSVVGGEGKVNMVIVTERKATKSQETAIRDILHKEMLSLNGKDFEDICKELLLGNFVSELAKKASKICSVKRAIPVKAQFTEKK